MANGGSRRCSRSYGWCAEEACTHSVDGSPARFHQGQRVAVTAGDDELRCSLVASEDAALTYVELELFVQGASTAAVWLTSEEADAVATQLDDMASAAGDNRLGRDRP